MNEKAPILIPFVNGDIYDNVKTVVNDESLSNNFIKNESTSPVPFFFEENSKTAPILNMRNIFSFFSKKDFESNNCSNFEHHNTSDSLFEKIYKDYSTILNVNFVNSTNDSKFLEDNVCKKMHINNGYSETFLINKSKKRKNYPNENFTNIKQKSSKKKLSQRSVAKFHANNEYQKLINDCRVKREKEVHPNRIISNTPNVLKDISDQKYLTSPFITFRSGISKKDAKITEPIGQCYVIVNSALRHSSNHFEKVYRPNIKSFNNSFYSKATICVCAFCGQTSEFLHLGNLYGPYFIDKDYIHLLPSTCVFPPMTKKSNIFECFEKNEDATTDVDFRVTPEGEVWFHMECVLWAPGTYLRGDGKIGGLEEGLKMALNERCFVCHKIGAILNCNKKNCEKNFHYYCAYSEDSKLNKEQFSVWCNLHKEQ